MVNISHTIDPDGDLLLLLKQPSNQTTDESVSGRSPNSLLHNATVAKGSGFTTSKYPLYSSPTTPVLSQLLDTQYTAISPRPIPTLPSVFGSSSTTPPTPVSRPKSIEPKPSLGSSSKNATNVASSTKSIEMLVASKILMVASPVFRAMLGNDAFREGKTLHSTRNLSIELPDDDPEAMKVLLDILHHRTYQVPLTITLGTLTHLTILVDKYQMIEVLGAYKIIWLTGDTALRRTIPKTFTSPDFAPWLAISSVLQLPKEFSAMTMLALQESKGKLCNMNYEGHDLPVPNSVIDRIETRRQSVIYGAITIVEEGIKKYQGPEVHCKDSRGGASCDALQLGSLLRGASAIGIWPTPSYPYDGLSWEVLSTHIRGIKITPLCKNSSYSPSPAFYSDDPLPDHGVMSQITRQIKHLEKAMGGLPLSSWDDSYGPVTPNGLPFQHGEARDTLLRLQIR